MHEKTNIYFHKIDKKIEKSKIDPKMYISRE